MLKEIHEQPRAIADTIGERFRDGELHLDGIGLTDAELAEVQRVLIVGCGTALHAGLVGRYLIEEWAGVATEADVASEWRYRNAVFDPRTLVLAISQSGETADTLAAMQLARERGAKVVAITNIMGSAVTREADGVLYTRAGLEIGVASSKMLHGADRAHDAVRAPARAAALAARAGAGRRDRPRPRAAAGARAAAARRRRTCTRRSRISPSGSRTTASSCSSGATSGLPICQEGALKLKEITYIPTDAYAGRRDEARADRAARPTTRPSSPSPPTGTCTRRSSRTSRR